MSKKTKTKKIKLTADEKVRNFFLNFHPDEADHILIPTGLEEAFIGTTSRDGKTVAVFSSAHCITALMKNLNCGWDEAQEFFDFNVVGAYVGPYTPIFVEPGPL